MKCLVLGFLVLVGFVHGEGVGECEAEQRCELRVRCPNQLRTRRSCETEQTLAGICCRLGRKTIRKRRSIPHEVFANALEEGHRVYSRKLEHIERTRKRCPVVVVEHAGSQFHSFLQPPRDGAASDDDAGPYEDVYATEAFADALNLTIAERVKGTKIRGKRCLPPVQCDLHARYRSIDGTCNNPVEARSTWGAAGYPFERLLPPAYEDGIWAPRLHSVTGRLLASPRTISVEVFPDFPRADQKHNLLLMQFGQFMSHDFTRSASIRFGKSDIQCCSQDHSHSLHPNDAHFACLPIEVSPEDPFYSKFNIRCLNFVRLALARDGKCKLGYGKQLNKITHFIDGSTVYGSSDEVASSLRTFSEGKLKATFPSGEELLPPEHSPDACEPTAKACFRAGDDRSNQIISLTTVHTLFLREHNRVATELSRINPHWNDEKLYQEARRIVIAEIQNLFYNEYLPLIVGPKRAEQYGLFDSLTGHTSSYSADVKPLVFNELSGAAYRFGHSTVAGAFFIQHRHRRSERVPIREFFLDPTRLTERSFFDDLLFSLIDQPQQQLDESTTRQLTQFLFAGSNPFGSDLVALNIQRGRDHALRPYNDYRQLAGLPRITSFHQFGPIGEQLASVYESPDDVDLWVGGVLEPPADDALIGETFVTIFSEQFAKLKFGDRYYYTNGPDVNPSFFTEAQLAQFRSLSLAAVICANVDHPRGFRVPAQAMLLPSEHNPPVACHHHPTLDLTAWRQH